MGIGSSPWDYTGFLSAFGKSIIPQFFAPFTRWWRAADEQSMAIMFKLFLATGLLWIIVADFLDFDSFRTLRTNTELSIAAKVTAAALVGVFTARSYFGPQTDIIDRYPEWSQLRKRTADWLFRGCALTVAATAAFWWLSGQALGIAAQHLKGSTATYHGNVILVRPTAGLRAVCRIDIAVRLHPSLSKMEFCLSIKGGKPAGPLELRPPDAVVILTRINSLGEAVDSIDYDDGAA